MLKNKIVDSKIGMQFLKYVIVGSTATIVDLIIFKLLIDLFSLNYSIALVAGFSLGVLTNFLLCDNFIFIRSTCFWKACLRHYSASLGSFIMHLSLMFLAISILKFEYPIIARIGISGCTFIINFLMFKMFSFNDN